MTWAIRITFAKHKKEKLKHLSVGLLAFLPEPVNRKPNEN